MLDDPAVNPESGIRAGGDGMQTSIATDSRKKWAVRSVLAFTFAVLTFILANTTTGFAFPAFARKYGLRCSACHVAWPVLNDFGWRFKDNGYQLMNDRDAPIWQNNAFWPVTFRITPNWHRENSNKVGVDTSAFGATTAEANITAQGFDLSGLDILSGGTLEKNISFLLVPSADNTGAFHFESAWLRLDNLLKSPWLNVKFGKFELDNFISEKRIMGLSNNGGFYQLYHFVPPGDSNTFGLGDNQLGLEWMGHSFSDHTRFSASLISSSDGEVNLLNSNSYSGYFAASQAFDLGGLGLQRVGAFALIGTMPTLFLNQTTGTGTFLPSTGEEIVSTAQVAGSAAGTKPFYRAGVFGDFYIKKLDVALYYQHGWEDKFLATSTPANSALPDGARNAVWNGGIVEPHLTINPQFIIFERNEWVRMSQQALPTNPSNLGDIDAYTVGYRWYPIMTSRAGFAFHNEYSWVRQRGTSPVTSTDLTSNSLFFGFDFDF
jgi:hypothetical protein